MTKPKSLVELAQNGGTPDEILATFANYADDGAAVSGHSIRMIVANKPWQPQQLGVAYIALERGLQDQVRRGFVRCAVDYLEGLNVVSKEMAALQVPLEETGGILGNLRQMLRTAYDSGNKAYARSALWAAVEQFRQYATQNDPNIRKPCVVKLTPDSEFSPGAPGIHAKSMTIGGRFVDYSQYLDFVFVTSDLRIEERG